MTRALVSIALVFALLGGALPLPSAQATDFNNPPNAVTWMPPDHTAKTINVFARLQIYSACDDCPGAVNLFLAQKIKKIIEDFWNQGFHYKCYLLHFDVDITLGTDRFGIDDDRVGVRIDNSPADIRSYVNVEVHSSSRWNSSDPADRVLPRNSARNPTTWRESANRDGSTTYAHEFGHVLGLHDTYQDQVDANGNVISVRLPNAPDDLMSGGAFTLSQETIDRLVERNGIREKDLKCACVGPTQSTANRPVAVIGAAPLGQITPTDICGYVGTVTMTYTNDMSFAGFEQHIELTLTGEVTWAPDPMGSTNQIPDSIGYLPVDGHVMWEQHGSFGTADATCTISGEGTYQIRDPQHYVFYASLEVATDPDTGISQYHGVGVEPPASDVGETTITCTPSGAVFPPFDESLAGSWLMTGSDEGTFGRTSDPGGRLSGTNTHDSSNQGTGIRTWTWDFQPY